METIIEKEQNSASYTRQNKRKPIVLLDSSYLLNELLDRRKTADFLDVCHYIKNVSNAHIIFLKPISDETKYISRNHSHNPQVKEGFEILGTIKLHQPYLEGDQEEIFGILVKNITEKANGLALRMGKLPLSEIDTGYCVHAIMLSKKRDVIAATRDSLIKKTLENLWPIVSQAFIKLKYPSTNLYFAEDIQSLEVLLSTY